jgi:hypothetical protein
MEIVTTGILPDMIPLLNKSDFQEGDRLFYELGYKIDKDFGYGSNWVKTGKFKEVKDPLHMIENDTYLDKPDYIKHHNFMLIKKLK